MAGTHIGGVFFQIDMIAFLGGWNNADLEDVVVVSNAPVQVATFTAIDMRGDSVTPLT